jgi:hypothetical protein
VQTVKFWKVWLIQLLLSEGSYSYIARERILREAAHHVDENMDEAIGQLLSDEVITLLITGDRIEYGITIGKLKQAQDIADQPPDEQETNKDATKQIAQPYIPDPEGYSYLYNLEDETPSERRGLYTIYYRKSDPDDFAARILTKGTGKYRTIYVGSLNDPNSIISRAWRDILEVARQSTDVSFTLQDLLQRDINVFGSNKQRGRVLLAIFRRLDRIRPIHKKGNSQSYRIISNEPLSVVTIDDFIFAGNKSGISEWFNDPESLPELDELQEHHHSTDQDSQDSADAS